jgi:hypothetical protein
MRGESLKPEDARAALESASAMRRASVRSAMMTPPLFLGMAAVLAVAYCVLPPLLGEPDGLSSVIFLLMWYAPMLGYWWMSARPRFGPCNAADVAMIFGFAAVLTIVQAMGAYGYSQGQVWAPFAAGGAAALIFLLAWRPMSQLRRERLVEQDQERLARGGGDQPGAWYVPMALVCAVLAPGAWGEELPIFRALMLLGMFVVIGLRLGMPGWPRRPMLEEWAALLLYVAANLGVWMLGRTGNVSDAGAWGLSATLSLTIILTCYVIAHFRLIDAGLVNE